jgi:hypothetical protein
MVQCTELNSNIATLQFQPPCVIYNFEICFGIHNCGFVVHIYLDVTWFSYVQCNKKANQKRGLCIYCDYIRVFVDSYPF